MGYSKHGPHRVLLFLLLFLLLLLLLLLLLMNELLALPLDLFALPLALFLLLASLEYLKKEAYEGNTCSATLTAAEFLWRGV